MPFCMHRMHLQHKNFPSKINKEKLSDKAQHVILSRKKVIKVKNLHVPPTGQEDLLHYRCFYNIFLFMCNTVVVLNTCDKDCIVLSFLLWKLWTWLYIRLLFFLSFWLWFMVWPFVPFRHLPSVSHFSSISLTFVWYSGMKLVQSYPAKRSQTVSVCNVRTHSIVVNYWLHLKHSASHIFFTLVLWPPQWKRFTYHLH